MRPNEKFSGRNHSRHLCKDCSKLGSNKLKYRQDVRDLERLVTWEGIIPRKRRATFEKFLSHDDPRIREYAAELAALDVEARKLSRALQEEWQQSDMNEPETSFWASPPEEDSLAPHSSTTESSSPDEDDLPF
jgi:hypothetical protein